MKIKSYIGIIMAAALLCTAIGAYGATASAVETENEIRAELFSAQYEEYLPSTWFKASKMNGNLTRSDAAYLLLYTYGKASGQSPDWIEYKTDLKDTSDVMLSRAVDIGFMSVGTDLKFNPSNTVTQQEMAVLMTKVVAKLGGYSKPTKALAYSDSSSIASWAKESVQFISEKQWVSWTTANKFEPAKNITVGRAVALSDSILAHYKVYPKTTILETTTDKYDVKGFKARIPKASELEVSISPEGNLKVFFSGVIKNRAQNTYKIVNQHLYELLDSNAKVSYDARTSLIQILSKGWDDTLQSYSFESDQYIRLDNGQISAVKPSANAILIKAGKSLNLEIIQ